MNILAINPIIYKRRYSRIEIATSFNQITTLISVSSLLGIYCFLSIIAGALILNIIAISLVTIKKCPYSELQLYYILLKYCRNAIYFMIVKINRMRTAWLKEEGGLFIFDFCIQMRGGLFYPNEGGGL